MTATRTELKVSYSVGYKKNLGNFSNADIHLSESETWTSDVSGLDEDAAERLSDERYEALKEKLDTRLVAALEELTS